MTYLWSKQWNFKVCFAEPSLTPTVIQCHPRGAAMRRALASQAPTPNTAWHPHPEMNISTSTPRKAALERHWADGAPAVTAPVTSQRHSQAEYREQRRAFPGDFGEPSTVAAPDTGTTVKGKASYLQAFCLPSEKSASVTQSHSKNWHTGKSRICVVNLTRG